MSKAKVQAGGILRKSKDETWRTPRLLRDRVALFFGGLEWLDPAAPPDNPLGATRFFCGPTPSRVPTQGPLFGEPTMEEANRLDGLHEPWDLPWWCNPPFAKSWYLRVLEQVQERPDQLGLLLLPVNRTEEAYAQELLALVRLRLFVRWPEGRGRIPFESSIDGAECKSNPFSSWILGFGDIEQLEARWGAFEGLGLTQRLEAL